MILTGVLREDFGDIQLVNIGLARVLEVLGGFDLFVVVQPYHVETLCAHNPEDREMCYQLTGNQVRCY